MHIGQGQPQQRWLCMVVAFLLQIVLTMTVVSPSTGTNTGINTGINTGTNTGINTGINTGSTGTTQQTPTPSQIIIILDQLKTALESTKATLASIHNRWQVDKYPNFLSSAHMTEAAWRHMSLRYQQKIIDAQLRGSSKFVISFLGSSVTAGHDNPVNRSFPAIVRDAFVPILSTLKVNVVVENGAVGNNPCMPYDLCTMAFASPDTDLIHWEQSFDCGLNEKSSPIIEQFLRQTILFQNSPIVVFSESSTPNWKPSECAANLSNNYDSDHKRSEVLKERDKKDKLLLAALHSPQTTKHIATELSDVTKALYAPWVPVLNAYKHLSPAIQLWYHGQYTRYRCLGPYVKDWSCCSAGWHPSILGHLLRADHYTYVWLLIFKDAVSKLSSVLQKHVIDRRNENVDIRSILQNMLEVISRELAPSYASTSNHKNTSGTSTVKAHLRATPRVYNDTTYSDSLRCYTAYLPNHNPQFQLANYILPPLQAADKSSFYLKTIEELMVAFIGEVAYQKILRGGYADFKYMYMGNRFFHPLSIAIEVTEPGFGFFCEPSLVRQRLPTGMKRLWSPTTSFYLTSIPGNGNGNEKTFPFLFNRSNAELLKVRCAKNYGQHDVCPNLKDTGASLCAQTVLPLMPGRYVLSVAPKTMNMVMLSTIIIP